MKKVAVVTGANRGLGFETCKELAKKGYKVILTSRREEKGKAAAEQLQKENLDVTFRRLDITSRESILEFAKFMRVEVGRVDALVNNAGIMPDSRRTAYEALSHSEGPEILRAAMETNVYGPFQLCQELIPLMEKNGYGRVVNVSSGMGQLSEMEGGFPAYRISKTALNAVTKIFAAETNGKNILVNSVCPGWVKTDMGGPGAERTLPEGADTIVWAATLPDSGPSGGFFRDREPLGW